MSLVLGAEHCNSSILYAKLRFFQLRSLAVPWLPRHGYPIRLVWVGGVGRWLEGHDSLRDLNELKRIFPTDHVKQLKLITLGIYIYIYILYGMFLVLFG